MGAFSPEPVDSGFKLPSWLFARLVVLAGFTVYVSFGVTTTLAPGWDFAARTVVFLVALWLALQLLFEAVLVLLDASLESERETERS